MNHKWTTIHLTTLKETFRNKLIQIQHLSLPQKNEGYKNWLMENYKDLKSR